MHINQQSTSEIEYLIKTRESPPTAVSDNFVYQNFIFENFRTSHTLVES